MGISKTVRTVLSDALLMSCSVVLGGAALNNLIGLATNSSLGSLGGWAMLPVSDVAVTVLILVTTLVQMSTAGALWKNTWRKNAMWVSLMLAVGGVALAAHEWWFLYENECGVWFGLDIQDGYESLSRTILFLLLHVGVFALVEKSPLRSRLNEFF